MAKRKSAVNSGDVSGYMEEQKEQMVTDRLPLVSHTTKKRKGLQRKFSRMQSIHKLSFTPLKKRGGNGGSNFRGMMHRNEAYLLAVAGSHFTLRATHELTSVKSTSVSVFSCPECSSRQPDP